MIARQKLTCNRHARPVAEKWILGAYDTVLKRGYIQLVEDRSAETLLPIISSWCEPGAIIYTDGWAAYNQLGSLGFRHHSVIHERHFVDPETGVHTNSVESYWQRCKRKLKKMYGTKFTLLPSYLDEFMWNERFGGSFFDKWKNTLKCLSDNH